MEDIDPKIRKALSGISGILVTPFDASDKIAPARLRPIVERAVTAGVHILVANGNTGEFYALTMPEAEAMVHAAADQIGGRVQLIGDDCGPTRPPSAWPLADAQMKKMRESLLRWGLKLAR